MNKLKQSIARAFDGAAKTYDSHAHLQRTVAQHLFALIRDRLKHCVFVVDAGCGTGYFASLLGRTDLQVIQLDIAYNMCRHAAHNRQQTTLQADIEHLPFADNSVAALFSSLTLQWSLDLEANLCQIHRILRPEAPFAFSTLGPDTLRELRKSSAKAGGPEHANRFASKQELCRNLTAAGFTDFVVEEKHETLYYPDIYALMRALKGLGANSKTTATHKFVGKDYFPTLDSLYRQEYGSEKGIPVSWQVFYVTGKK